MTLLILTDVLFVIFSHMLYFTR